MKNQASKKYILIGAIVLVLIVLAAGFFNQAGYVLDGPYLVRGGTLTIENALPNSEVYIDNEKRGDVTASTSTLKIIGIAPGTHTVIIAHDMAWPWIREFESAVAENHIISPLQISQSVTGEALAKDDPSFEQAIRLLADYREPTQSQPLKWADAKLWVLGTTVKTQRGDEVFNTLRSQYPIRSVAWYQDRTDVVLVAASNSIFAIDLEESAPQNFQPIYKGVEPAFVVNPDNSNELYVSDGEHILSINLK